MRPDKLPERTPVHSGDSARGYLDQRSLQHLHVHPGQVADQEATGRRARLSRRRADRNTHSGVTGSLSAPLAYPSGFIFG